ncbi:MAG: LysM peptidoglycan-binding domain-containing protein [Gammaproteobacteria bacterium]|nr:LysM peptidoglycan-binding domain-containing protein [Gammaproteobacteria bacterium]MDE1888366.1 LysM peptidoglycan-binding domain-containing protein [Gammaproteobacteria bacterium]MDE2023803.1 LysM peptidoglycan-binding domain-containing protein [Gammaproteobacteria bacterium]
MIKNYAKQLAIVLLTAGIAVGCATHKVQPQAAPPPPPGPNAATTQAIADAQAVINGAQAPCTDTGDASQLLTQAQAAGQAGDNAKAQQLAAQAKQDAETALNTCYLNHAKDLLTQAQGYTNLNADEQNSLNQCQTDINNNQGKQAYDTCSALVAQLQAAKSTYTVVRGDSLWRIAGKSDVYGNALEWPLIFKANSDSIKHADLIYPKQNLNVVSNPLKTDVDSATWYAQHRGAWKNHRADKRDQEWLNGTLTPPAAAASPAPAAMPSPAPAATSAPAATTH